MNRGLIAVSKVAVLIMILIEIIELTGRISTTHLVNQNVTIYARNADVIATSQPVFEFVVTQLVRKNCAICENGSLA